MIVFLWLAKRRKNIYWKIDYISQKREGYQRLVALTVYGGYGHVTTHSSSSQPGRVQTPSDRAGHAQLFRFTLSLRLSLLLSINLSMPPSVCVWFSVCRPLSFFQSVYLCFKAQSICPLSYHSICFHFLNPSSLSTHPPHQSVFLSSLCPPVVIQSVFPLLPHRPTLQ